MMVKHAENAVKCGCDVNTQTTVSIVDGVNVYFVVAFKFDPNEMNFGRFVGKACFMHATTAKEAHVIGGFLWEFAGEESMEISRWVNPNLN